MDDTYTLLFDGQCALCNRAVDFILRRDARRRFRFASLQSAAGAALARSAGAPAGVDSMVLIRGGAAWVRSAAALKIARGLGPPWSLLGALALLPRGLRDAIYDRVAANRYAWFGRQACRVPSPEERSRFLE